MVVVKRVRRVFANLSVVYGCDEFAGVEQLVTALLEEPFASDEQRRVLLDRWKTASGQGEGSLVIRCVFFV